MKLRRVELQAIAGNAFGPCIHASSAKINIRIKMPLILLVLREIIRASE
jgi:hypothetical protein